MSMLFTKVYIESSRSRCAEALAAIIEAQVNTTERKIELAMSKLDLSREGLFLAISRLAEHERERAEELQKKNHALTTTMFARRSLEGAPWGYC